MQGLSSGLHRYLLATFLESGRETVVDFSSIFPGSCRDPVVDFTANFFKSGKETVADFSFIFPESCRDQVVDCTATFLESGGETVVHFPPFSLSHVRTQWWTSPLLSSSQCKEIVADFSSIFLELCRDPVVDFIANFLK